MSKTRPGPHNIYCARNPRFMADLASLVAYTALGDRDAFAKLYRATRSRGWAICMRLLRDRAAAEDALQDAYVKVWQQAASYRQHLGTVEAWFSTIVRNTCLDRLRTQERDARLLEDSPLEESVEAHVCNVDTTPEMQLMLTGQRHRLQECIDQLDVRQQDLVVSAYVMGQSHAELAAERRLPLGTVKSLIRRAVLWLRDCMGGVAT